MRVVADHVRAMTFLIADGVMPSNEWRGYVLRKIMRRAMRHGKHLGFTEPFLHTLVAVLDAEMGDAYPGIRANREMIEKSILAEEHRFETVLTDGLPRLEAELAKVLGTKSKVLPGDAAFKLYDTFGIPYDFIEDTAATAGVTVDKDAFDQAMGGQRDKARAKSGFGVAKDTKFVLTTERSTKPRDHSRGLYDDERGGCARGGDVETKTGNPRRNSALDRSGYVALARTPFYLRGRRRACPMPAASPTRPVPSRRGQRTRAYRPGRTTRAHQVHVTSGTLKTRDIVTADVDAEVRNATRRNHTATHLLHRRAGDEHRHAQRQKGSLVSPDRLRFDFSHFQPVTRDELDHIERLVNEQVYRNTPVTTDVDVAPETAIASGAMALFGEKYGDKVRVVRIPGFQHRAVRRHARECHRRHRLVCDSCRERRRRRSAPHRGRHGRRRR